MATLPAAALLYRRGHVQEARTTYVFTPGREQLFNRAISPANSVALRTAAEKGRLAIAMPRTPELPWLEESPLTPGAKVINDPAQSLIEPDATSAVSDTGELRRNWEQGVYSIDTPRSQAAMGEGSCSQALRKPEGVAKGATRRPPAPETIVLPESLRSGE